MRYIGKKLLTLLATLLAVSFLSYAAFEMIGDPVATILGTNATPEAAAQLRADMGLDRPLPLRYGEWLWHFMGGDMGTSYIYRLPVREMIGEKLAVTLIMTLMAVILTVAVSVPAGAWLARREGRPVDKVFTVLNQILMAVPPFFVAVLLTVVFGLLLRVFTPGRFVPYTESWPLFLFYMIFPALSVALPRIAMTTKMLRASALEELGRDYILTAYSRGHSRRSALKAHALKNAMLPVVTFLAANAAEMLAGGIVIEQLFSVPGIGRLLLSSIGTRDIPVVEAIVLILAVWVMLIHLIGDILGQILDPRVRL
ncbi:MAG: ABC transporter permease [Lachnospiraceae bacterium]|nr:ABC transporter permease [Lachnospiraceae bacterium]